MTIQQCEEFEQVAREYYSFHTKAKADIKKIEQDLKGKADKLQDLLKTCENKKHTDENMGFSLKLVEPQKPVFDVEKLEQAIPVNISKVVVKKKFAVTNETYFVALMKRFGVSSDELKLCLSLEKTVDNDAVFQALSLGEIDTGMLNGTYVIENKKAYIKLTERR